ncbi:hypothetical protein ATANTOWER_004793 [Ataeniobius toweri]|uniref:Uncharacterized protein n=1 Tax=Ataeniobius toweri TaxID=208326 RepID=A0ABU7BX05_9TELE|nr:hypothetical protein [Ataeniobius toweri]
MLHRDRGFGWGSWSWGPPRGTLRLSELRPWMSGGVAVAGGGSVVGDRGDKGGKVRCSRRVWLLLGTLALVFLTSLFLSVSLRGGVGFNYLEPPGWEESRRVKLVPSYMGAHRLSSPETPLQKTCACPRCVGDPGVSDWFDENYDPDISPVWTRNNIQLPSDVYYWWVCIGRRGSSLSRETQTSLSPATWASSSRGNPKAFPGQPRNIVTPACPGSSSGPPHGGTCPEHLTREASRRHSNQMPKPPQLAPLDVEKQWLYSESLPDDRVSPPISKGEPRHPAEETHFGCLYL